MPSSTIILLIEEDVDLRSLIRDLLERMGYWVIAVPRTEALSRVLRMASRVDLVVADVTVPDGESIDLTQELLAGFPALPALVVATDDTELAVKRQFSQPRTRFLGKPFSFDELREAVENALALASSATLEAPARGDGGRKPVPGVLAAAVAGVHRLSGRRFAAGGLIAAAALVMVAGFVLRGLEATPPPLPEIIESTVRRGEVFSVVEPVGDRPRVPSRLVWKESAGAALYRVQIRSVFHELLWEATPQQVVLPVPPDLGRRLEVGVVYFWTVEALDADGNLLMRSPEARFQIVPPRQP